MKISFITTLFNEEKTIERFLDSILSQTQLPDEVIIVDGGSSDETVSKIKKYSKYKKITFKLFSKKGNRSVGRNEAIKKSSNPIIVCSDSGNILDKNWIKNITKPFKDKATDVVAGYYKGKTETTFQKCLLPYAFVMPDKVNPKKFLPATRSIAFTKAIWKKVGGFDERYSHNEDYVFAKKLEEIGAEIVFAKDAIVYWLPRNTVKEAFVMFFRFAFGDAEAKIIRTKVILLFLRYAAVLYLLAFAVITKSLILILILSASLLAYIVWAIWKNYKYVKDKEAFYWLPILQFTADFAVLIGTVLGALRVIKTISFTSSIFSNPWFIALIVTYLLAAFVQIGWGIPNPSHPFMYNMDEWHGMQSIRSVFTIGTTNVAGAAYGSVFFYFTTGLYLIPFVLFHIIDPFAIKSSVGNLIAQQHLFEVLRLNTILYGVGAIYLVAKISKNFFKGNALVTAALFTFTPIFILLSGYFKYDVAVTFWILLSLFFLLRYSNSPTLNNFVFAGIVSALSVAIKISALPLLPIFFISFFLFTPKPFKQLKQLLYGVSLCIFTLFVFGFPDVITAWAGYYDLLHLNLVTIPQQSVNLILGGSDHLFLLKEEYPAIFGYFLYSTFIASLGYWLIKLLFSNEKKMLKKELFIVISLAFFVVSLIPLKVGGGGNRSLVLLPFLVLIVSMTIPYIFGFQNRVIRFGFITLVCLGLAVQVAQSYAWLSVKLAPDPRHISSQWLEEHIKARSTIGIENIPIYQMLPDSIVKEFYNKQYGLPVQNKFNYLTVDAKSKQLPQTVVITNIEQSDYMVQSPKRGLVNRLQKEGYKDEVIFTPDVSLYKYTGDTRVFIFANLVNAPTSIRVYLKPTNK